MKSWHEFRIISKHDEDMGEVFPAGQFANRERAYAERKVKVKNYAASLPGVHPFAKARAPFRVIRVKVTPVSMPKKYKVEKEV